MPANTYEGMFLLDSTKAAAAWDDTVKHVHDILAKHNSEIVASRQWDERRLAYPISGHKEGDVSADLLQDRRHQAQGDCCRLPSERPDLESCILKVHPKLEVQLVNQAMTSTPNAEAEEAAGRDEEMDDRPRRRRRDE